MPQSRGRRHKPGEKARSRARARRLAGRPEEDFDVVMQFGAVADLDDEEGLAEVRQVTHDRVRKQTANLPGASGVTWYTVPAATDMEQCRKLIGTAGDHSPEAQEAREGLISYLESAPSAGLIVATVQVPRRPRQERAKAGLS
jgi:hypothetical protein